MKLYLLALSLVATAAAWAEPEIGKPAPAFTLPNDGGSTTSLAQYKGKYVVLEWTNYECPFVKKHYGSGNMQALQKEFTAKGVVWLSVISSAPGKQGYLPPDQIKAAAEQQKIFSTTVLSDADGKVGRLYDAKTTPDMFIINPEGILIYAGGIDDKPSTNAADIPTATNYVRVALGEAMAGKPVTTAMTKSYGCTVKY